MNGHELITTRWAPRTRRLLLGALVLSMAVHVFGGAFWARAVHLVAHVMHRLPQQQQREQEVATSDVVRLERRTIPRPARASRARPAPQRVPQPVRRPAQPVVPRMVIAPKAAVAHPRSTLTPPRKTASKPAASALPEIAHRSARGLRHAPPPVRRLAKAAEPDAASLSAQQIAQLNAQFAQTIAASRQDLATIQKQTEERPVAIKHFPMQFAGLQSTLQRGEGYIEPITMGQRIGGTVWYYTHYTYMWPDGHLEDDDIPWPFHYPVDRDLFAMRVHLIPVQLPPPGFRLTRPLKPFLARFVATNGQG